MPKDKPIQAIGFKWKQDRTFICGIQLIMSNGCNSPVLLGKNQNVSDLKEVKITPQVKKIRGTIVGTEIGHF